MPEAGDNILDPNLAAFKYRSLASGSDGWLEEREVIGGELDVGTVRTESGDDKGLDLGVQPLDLSFSSSQRSFKPTNKGQARRRSVSINSEEKKKKTKALRVSFGLDSSEVFLKELLLIIL